MNHTRSVRPKDLPARYGAMFAVGYFGLYMVWLWFSRESEAAHYVTLVAVPFVGLLLLARLTGAAASPRAMLQSFGVARHGIRRGLGLAALVGLIHAAVILAFSDPGGPMWNVVTQGKILLMPLAFLFALGTVAFTEEFFFRGILHTRLRNWLHTDVGALIVSSLLFGVYHFPYRYSVTGEVASALVGCGYAVLTGMLLGFVFMRSRYNLLGPMVAHALFDVLPILSMLQFAIHFG